MKFLGKTCALVASSLLLGFVARAQMIDNTQATSTTGAGINKSLSDEIGAGRGSIMTPGSSLYMINRDPFRSIRRGRTSRKPRSAAWTPESG